MVVVAIGLRISRIREAYRFTTTSTTQLMADSTAPLPAAAPTTHQRQRLSPSMARSSSAMRLS